ncbi:hypothetical protein [Bifidobacterium thermophilum]|uniref:Uncharacterized protein n=1 Tax=Bifidobacterium thermophilum RBL67 TaxID=1254439 RepID=M4RCV6_9BIFI|nr:hypothetical protein [Bifidobacterium thermophilum]AGH40353.1 hypothetical protein D805_0086 [Bifidobacterium thermophilum RBL67]MDW8485817.1 hypothetical protein [Bifidobacterium thermophilum]
MDKGLFIAQIALSILLIVFGVRDHDVLIIIIAAAGMILDIVGWWWQSHTKRQ